MQNERLVKERSLDFDWQSLTERVTSFPKQTSITFIRRFKNLSSNFHFFPERGCELYYADRFCSRCGTILFYFIFLINRYYFLRTVLDLQKKIIINENMVQRLLHSPYPVSPVFISYISMVCLLQLINQYGQIIIN